MVMSNIPAQVNRWLELFPTAEALAEIAKKAFFPLLRSRVQEMVKANDAYNAQILRVDGHFKVAKRIVLYIPGGKGKRERPFTCILAFCGVDGSLLRPPVPLRSECLEEIQPILQPLLNEAAGDNVADFLQDSSR